MKFITSGYQGTINAVVTTLNPGDVYIGVLFYITSFIEGNDKTSKTITNFLEINTRKYQIFNIVDKKVDGANVPSKSINYSGLWVLAEKQKLARTIPYLSEFKFHQDVDQKLLNTYQYYKNKGINSATDYENKESSLAVFTKGLYISGRLTGYREFETVKVRIRIYNRMAAHEKIFKFIYEIDTVLTITNNSFRYNFILDDGANKTIATDRENEYNGKKEYIYLATLRYIGNSRYDTAISKYLKFNSQIIRAASHTTGKKDELDFTDSGWRVCTNDLLGVAVIENLRGHTLG